MDATHLCILFQLSQGLAGSNIWKKSKWLEASLGKTEVMLVETGESNWKNSSLLKYHPP